MDIGEGHHRVRPHGDFISATGSELWEEAQEDNDTVVVGVKRFTAQLDSLIEKKILGRCTPQGSGASLC